MHSEHLSDDEVFLPVSDDEFIEKYELEKNYMKKESALQMLKEAKEGKHQFNALREKLMKQP